MKIDFIKRWLVFPFLYPIAVVLDFFFSSYYEATIQGLLFSFITVLLFVGITWAIFNFVFKDHSKSALLVFLSTAFFFSFQNIVFTLITVSNRVMGVDSVKYFVSNAGQRFVFGFLVLFIVIFLIFVRKLQAVSGNTIVFLNLLSIVFLFATVIRGSVAIYRINAVRQNFEQYWDNEIEGIDTLKVGYVEEKPDIYYIILDGFARSDILLDLYGLDNSNFIKALQDKGFYVSSESSANYPTTRTYLASTLNMRYLNDVSAFIGDDSSIAYAAYTMIDNSVAEKMLRLIGYEMTSFRSITSYTFFSDWDNLYQPQFHPDYYTQTFISNTGLSIFLNSQMYRWHYNLINYAIDTLPEAVGDESPKFVFAHILCPHPPFIFRPDGSIIIENQLFMINDGDSFFRIAFEDDYRTGYKSQVTYIQDAILETIDEIIGNSEGPLIIVLQADHGSRMQDNYSERRGILNAIYFYDQDYELLYPQISPVNTLRVIFSNYFGIDKPLLEDKFYYNFDN